jgi:ribosomal protein S18 acetylase RimI-like enzyme
VGRALLTRSFAELATRGHHEVRLGVDTENTTGATHLYAGVGMTVRRRFDLYEKLLTGA